ncbi:MAG: hypothetical protein E7608_05755 [Ruminococcaceae bacterium]|nr:hypothetical protein [Oscillospiraceae bacterium]
MTKKESLLKILVCIMCVWCVAFSVIFPKTASEAAFRALRLCAQRVVPSLFLFMAASKILLACGGARILSFLTAGLPERAFNLSKSGTAAVILGLLCGYPTGAVVISQALSRGEMTQSEAQSVLPFATAASPAFLAGTVGGALFSSPRYGYVLIFSQAASSFILLLLTRKKRSESEFLQKSGKKEEPFLPLLADAVKEAGVCALYVCSFITFFCVFCTAILYFLPIGKTLNALVNGFFEISCGFAALAELECTLFEKYFLAGAILGFSGVSVFMQSASFVCESGISMKKYTLGKCVQAVLCGAICFAAGVFSEKGAVDIAFAFFGTQAPKILLGADIALVSVLILALCAAFIALGAKILRFFSKK